MRLLHLTSWDGPHILPGHDEGVDSCIWFQALCGSRPCCPNHGAPVHRQIWASPGHLCGLMPCFPEVEADLKRSTDGNLTGHDFSSWHLWRVGQPELGAHAGHIFWKFVLTPEVHAPNNLNWAPVEVNQHELEVAGWVHLRQFSLDDCVENDLDPNGWDNLLHNDLSHFVHDRSNTFHHVHVGIYVDNFEGFAFG